MALLPAIGLGVAIIVLRVLAPEIWSALQHLIVHAFRRERGYHSSAVYDYSAVCGFGDVTAHSYVLEQKPRQYVSAWCLPMETETLK